MKKQACKRLAVIIMALVFLLAMAGCAGEDDSVSEEDIIEEPVYPVSLNGIEIIVGETRMQVLLDAGYEVTWSEMTPDNQITQYTVDSNMVLEANSFYSGGSVWFTDHSFFHIAMVTDDEDVPMGEAVIARMDFYFSPMEDRELLNDVIFNGVSVNEFTQEKAVEMFPDFKGNEITWFSTGLREYAYSLDFSAQTGEMTGLEVQRKYDVDWNGG